MTVEGAFIAFYIEKKKLQVGVCVCTITAPYCVIERVFINTEDAFSVDVYRM